MNEQYKTILKRIRQRLSSIRKKQPAIVWIVFAVLVIAFSCAGMAFGVLLGYEYNLPPIQSLDDYRPDVITTIYADDGGVIGEFAIEKRIVVSYDEIPPNMRYAIIAVEDASFFHHSGINFYAIARSVIKDFIRQSYPLGKGASTITMQLSRMLLESYEKTWDRKIREIWVARKIEQRYSKQQILALYANLHIMGPGIYGVAAAAEYYFGKPLKDLSLEECALIAGLPRSPRRYSPRRHPDAALARRNFVLDRMATENVITVAEAAAAKRRPIVLAPAVSREKNIAPYFVEWVRQSLAGRYSTDEIWRRGMHVYTTLNIPMQRAARRALREGLRDFDKKHGQGWSGPIDNVFSEQNGDLTTYRHPDWRGELQAGDVVIGLVEEVDDKEAVVRIDTLRDRIGNQEISWTGAPSVAHILKPGDLAWFRVVAIDHTERSLNLTLEQRPKVEGAFIIIENRTGAIRALVGGYDFASSEFNRVTQARRQVGSTFKPVVYAAALEQGLHQTSIVLDAPLHYTDRLGRSWNPSNYDRQFKGEMTLRQALAESRNIPAIRIAERIGIRNVVIMARRFGFAGRLDPYLPLALGSCEATPLELASAFTVFPNLGFQAKPYFLHRIEDYNHVKKEDRQPELHQVLDPAHASEMLELLRNVVANGTGRAALSLGRPLGGKTGTTNNFTDAWFVGFTPSLTAAVWIGYDTRKSLGERQSGGALALPIWVDAMREILADQPVEQFPTVDIVPDADSPIYVGDLPK